MPPHGRYECGSPRPNRRNCPHIEASCPSRVVFRSSYECNTSMINHLTGGPPACDTRGPLSLRPAAEAGCAVACRQCLSNTKTQCNRLTELTPGGPITIVGVSQTDRMQHAGSRRSSDQPLLSSQASSQSSGGSHVAASASTAQMVASFQPPQSLSYCFSVPSAALGARPRGFG